jgi:hypothetical protein
MFPLNMNCHFISKFVSCEDIHQYRTWYGVGMHVERVDSYIHLCLNYGVRDDAVS